MRPPLWMKSVSTRRSKSPFPLWADLEQESSPVIKGRGFIKRHIISRPLGVSAPENTNLTRILNCSSFLHCGQLFVGFP